MVRSAICTPQVTTIEDDALHCDDIASTPVSSARFQADVRPLFSIATAAGSNPFMSIVQPDDVYDRGSKRVAGLSAALIVGGLICSGGICSPADVSS